MAIQILKGYRKREEQLVSRYMQEIRDIVKGGFSRRELLRMGLVWGGAGLAALQGLRGFQPYWAHAASGRDRRGRDRSDSGRSGRGLRLVSPPNTPFQDPLPIPAIMQPTVLDPAPTKGPNPVASAFTGFTEAPRPDHQRWTQFGGTSDIDPGFTGAMYEIVQLPTSHDFYPAVDGVPPSTIWTYFDATKTTNTVEPLVLQARHGVPIVLRIHNSLPLANQGFGVNQTSIHLHGGHVASESDGGPLQFYEFGQFKDFHYPNARAGFASTHPTSTLNGRTVLGDVRETQSFLWFHDHRFDFTAQNVYKGLLSFYTLFSDDILLDTGDETTGLRLPSGPYDIPMVFGDKVFDPQTGELFFDLFNLDGILGDRETVNGKIQPFLEVKRRKYRFRFLVAGPSRVYEFFLSSGQDFIQITNDGNLLPRPLPRKSVRLSPAERADVIVDFSAVPAGSKVYLENRLEQRNGAGPTGRIIAPTNLVEFRVGDAAQDDSQIPAALLDVPVLPRAVRNREWEFDLQGGVWVVNDRLFDPEEISAFPKQNTAEIWTLDPHEDDDWQHPIHIHMEEFLVLSRGRGVGVPVEEQSRKDVVRIGQGSVGTRGTEARVFLQFRDFLGDYPMHCHNTVHEDHAMMIRFQVVP